MVANSCEICFKVKAPLQFGEDLRVCGNVPALGCNDPSRGVPLATSPSAYPFWTTIQSVPLSCERTIEYRYCVFRAGAFHRWEAVPEPRVLDNNILTQPCISASRSVLDALDTLSPPTPGKQDASCASSSSTSEQKYDTLDEDSQQYMPALDGIKATANRRRTLKRRSTHRAAEPVISANDGVVVVSYFLPIVLSRSEDGKWSADWDYENLLSLQTHLRVTWVGIAKFRGGIPDDQEEEVARVLRELNCIPVFIDTATHEKFYKRFCKGVMWPVLHHIADVYGHFDEQTIGGQAQQELWYTYTVVNRQFRDKIVEAYHEGDLVWVHGFHLMLLPSFLQRTLHMARIGVFFHTPFPSSEIWRTLPFREELLRGILAADQIGFHLYEYARHFLTACRRLLGFHYAMDDSGQLVIDVNGRHVAITSIHVGVDLPQVNFLMNQPTFNKASSDVTAKYGDRKVVCGIDRLERLKGVAVKMVAIERFFRAHPEWVDKVVFIQIGVTAAERGADYLQTKELVRRIVNRINEKYSGEHPAVVFEEKSEQSITLARRLELFAAADVLLTVAPRDGLNRTPIEFTLAHHGEGREPGTMVLSEFVSAARVMRGAIKLNPWRVADVVDAVQSALEADSEERIKRHAKCIEFAARQTTSAWAFQVLLDLKRVNKEYIDPQVYSALGLGLGYRVVGLHAGFQPLNTALVSKCYRTSRNRLIVLDYGGTLTAHEDKADKVKAYAVASKLVRRTPPSRELLQLLKQLCSDQKNTVYVISGQELYAVAEGFGNVKGLGLAAEHGFYFRVPREHSDGQPRWQTLLSSADHTWKQLVKQIMEVYVQRTSGTYIEQKGTAMIWQFRDADPEFGYMQSKELEDHLTAVLRPFAVEVLRGGGVSDGYIEVRPEGVSKGSLLEHLLSTARTNHREPDFVLVVGDDVSDEPMYQAVDRAAHDDPTINAFSVTVGKKPSQANSYLDDPQDVIEMLTSLTRLSTLDSKFYSMVDLTKLNRSHAAEPFLLHPLEIPANRRPSNSNSPLSAGHSPMHSSASGEALSPMATSSPIHRSMSMGHLSRLPQDVGVALPRTHTLRHTSQTIVEYLGKIEENEEDEDGGIFF